MIVIGMMEGKDRKRHECWTVAAVVAAVVAVVVAAAVVVFEGEETL